MSSMSRECIDQTRADIPSLLSRCIGLDGRLYVSNQRDEGAVCVLAKELELGGVLEHGRVGFVGVQVYHDLYGRVNGRWRERSVSVTTGAVMRVREWICLRVFEERCRIGIPKG